jgi:hypothetical protein
MEAQYPLARPEQFFEFTTAVAAVIVAEIKSALLDFKAKKRFADTESFKLAPGGRGRTFTYVDTMLEAPYASVAVALPEIL